nr:MAG TPA: hypothetical protein [Herelleviridae sp.]
MRWSLNLLLRLLLFPCLCMRNLHMKPQLRQALKTYSVRCASKKT